MFVQRSVHTRGASPGAPVLRGIPSLLKRSADEIAEERMRPGRLGLEFGVELNGQEPGMVQQLDDLDDRAVGAGSGGDQPVLVESLAIVVVELIPMTMPFADPLHAVGLTGQAVGREHAGPGPQAHGAAALADRLLVFHQADHGVIGGLVELGAVGVLQAEHAAGELDHRALHAQADAEVGHLARPREADRLDLALDSAHAEATRNQDAVNSSQECLGSPAADLLGLDRHNQHASAMSDPGVIE